MVKAPFERVFSLVDRRRLLQRVIKDKVKVLLKTPNGHVMEFKTKNLDEGFNLNGQIIGGTLNDYEKITALFYVDKDRYFLRTRIKKKKEYFQILNDPQLYRLNRRTAFRTQVPASFDLSYYVQTIRNIEINKKMTVLEFSSSGARLFWRSSTKLSKGTLLKGYLQWGSGKTIPVDCAVIHSPEVGLYGIRFVNLSSITLNRLKMLSVEIQHAIHFS